MPLILAKMPPALREDDTLLAIIHYCRHDAALMLREAAEREMLHADAAMMLMR